MELCRSGLKENQIFQGEPKTKVYAFLEKTMNKFFKKQFQIIVFIFSIN